MNKKQLSVITAYCVILIVFTTLFFIIPFNKNASVWAMFLFAEASIVLGCGITLYAFSRGGTLSSKIYGLPIFRVGYIYTVLQLAASVIIFIVNIKTDTPAWLSALIGLVLLAFAIIGTIAADNAADMIENTDKNIKGKISRIKGFITEAEGIADRCTDPEAKKVLDKIAEKLKYSDPGSSPALDEAESRIAQALSELSAMLGNGTSTDISDKAENLLKLIDDRNRRCRSEKH